MKLGSAAAALWALSNISSATVVYGISAGRGGTRVQKKITACLVENTAISVGM